MNDKEVVHGQENEGRDGEVVSGTAGRTREERAFAPGVRRSARHPGWHAFVLEAPAQGARGGAEEDCKSDRATLRAGGGPRGYVGASPAGEVRGLRDRPGSRSPFAASGRLR